MGLHSRADRPRRLRWQAACILDADGRFLNASPSLAAFFSCPTGTLLGQSLLDRMGPAEASQVAPLLAEAAAGQQLAFQARLQGAGGASVWVRIRLRPGGCSEAGPLVVVCIEPPHP